MLTMKAFEMTKRDSARFLKLFEKIDWDHGGTIDIEELFGYLKMDVAGRVESQHCVCSIA